MHFRERYYVVYRTLVSVLMSCLLMVSPLGATTILGMNIDEVAQGAEIIFEGKVVEHNVRENDMGMIVTYVTFRIEELIKGEYYEQLLELKFTGGRLDEQIMEVRVSTVNDRPITDVLSTQSVPVALRRPVSFIDGDTAPATGVVAPSQILDSDQALTTESFKAKVRALFDN